MGLPIIDFASATGALRELYERMLERPIPAVHRPAHGGVPGIVTAHSLDPQLIPKVFEVAATLDDAGPLSWPERELVNATTARANRCAYSTACHAEFLRVALDGDDTIPRAVIASEPLPAAATPRMHVLGELAMLVSRAPWQLSRTHRDRAHAAGLDDAELLHAITLAALFGHLNRVADATSVPLDYPVTHTPPAADPSVPALAPAPVVLATRPTLELSQRAPTAAALAAWRTYVFDRDAPLPRRQRTFIARWVALWLGDGGISRPDDLTQNPLDGGIRALAELVTLAPWRLGDHAYVELRRAGFDDAALFDVVVTASTAGMLSRIEVALGALGRERT